MALSSVLSSALEMLLVRNYFLTISSGISLQDFIQPRTRFLDCTFFFPAGVNSKGPIIIHDWYSLLILSLKTFFRHLSNGCRTGIRPMGITATSIFCCCNTSLTDSVRWAWKESQTNNDRSTVRVSWHAGMNPLLHTYDQRKKYNNWLDLT